MKKLALLAAVGLGSLIGQANASVITGVTATATSSAFGFDRVASHVVDGSGYDPATGFVSTMPDGTMWLSNGNGALGGVPDPAPAITFDLGSVYSNLGSVKIWNYNETANLGAGIATGTVMYSTDGVTYTSLANFALAEAPGSATTDFGQTIALNVSARFIELTNLANYAGAGSFVGLSEAVFSTVDAVPAPEPASLLMLTAGLLGLGVARARARR